MNKNMRMRLLVCATLGLGLIALPAYSADTTTKAPAAIAGKPGMGVKDRFHQVHAKKKKLECADCHDKGQTDILYLRKDDRMSPKLSAEGQVDREGCLTCHKPGDRESKNGSYWGI